VLICLLEGELLIDPDSPEWLSWLASLSSFRFVGQVGRFSATRVSDRGLKRTWYAYRTIHQHDYKHAPSYDRSSQRGATRAGRRPLPILRGFAQHLERSHADYLLPPPLCAAVVEPLACLPPSSLPAPWGPALLFPLWLR
jgi:hypothetical protein